MSIGAQVRKLEDRVLINPKDGPAIRRLVTLLDLWENSENASGTFGATQARINEDLGPDWRQDMLDRSQICESYHHWMSVLSSAGMATAVPIAQAFSGRVMTIKGQQTHCDTRIKFFKETKVISRLCHDCYKVQILPSNLDEMFQTYFLLLLLNLPNDNARKCMIELRDGIKYPYKGYIYCQSIEEAKDCMVAFESLKIRNGIKGIRTKISHGCSEFVQEYPDFKFNEAEAFSEFKVPDDWVTKETRYFKNLKLPTSLRKTNSKTFLSLRDVFSFRTWVKYAELIGDEASESYRSQQGPNLLPTFIQRVQKQAKKRNSEMKALVETD
ncbi:hypothetical protein [Ruegeria lacuscaerulensis]|uniref:hypothetical protein n=1 Tax=Ruegeria lacuscaerulensis TaxID=55218 RepID=UPI0014807528|nr:hypothetical protein [Ruegeria lacuscaerulensis]